MGGAQAKITSQKSFTKNELIVVPSKSIFEPGEDITGQVVLNIKEPMDKAGILVIALEGKEQFEYVPHSKSNQVFRNVNKFIREREVLAQFDGNMIPAGRYVYQFQFQVNSNFRKPPSVTLIQDLKGFGVLDLRCAYKVSASIYDLTSRVDKVMKRDFPLIIKDVQLPSRKQFIEQGKSEVMCCLGAFGSGGISSFQIKCPKDLYLSDETISFNNRIDNSRNAKKIKCVEIKLIRVVRLHTGTSHQQVGGFDLVFKQEIFKKKYEGAPQKHKDRGYNRAYELDLDQIFENDNLISEIPLHKDIGFNRCMAPTSYGKIFMCHYVLQVSMRHPGIFAVPTSLEVDLTIEPSSKDLTVYQQYLAAIQEQANSFLNGP